MSEAELSSIAGANKKAILDGLISILKEITDFGNRVYKGYRQTLKEHPAVLIHLFEDVVTPEAVDEDSHLIHFNVLIKMVADIQSDAETEMDNFIELVGKVEDKIKANHGNPGVWEDLAYDRISYTFGQSRTVIYYNAMMSVRARSQW